MLAELLLPLGVSSRVEADHERWAEAVAALGPGDLLSVNALRWRMLAARYDHLRDEWAYQTPPALRAAIEGHVAAGGAVLSLHTSCICFDDWDGWAEILGLVWDWDRSHHPPVGRVEVTRHDGAGGFGVQDEVYHCLRPPAVGAGVEVVATATVAADQQPIAVPPAGTQEMGAPQLVAWRRVLPGGARVVVDTLGHDHRSLGHASHRLLLRSLASWAIAQSSVEPTRNGG